MTRRRVGRKRVPVTRQLQRETLWAKGMWKGATMALGLKQKKFSYDGQFYQQPMTAISQRPVRSTET